MNLQDHAKPVYCTIIDDDDGDGGGGGGKITPSEPIGNIPTGIPTKLPGYFEWTDIIRCALHKINGPSQGELLQPFTELEKNLADRIMDFATPIQIVKGISYARRGGADDDDSKKKKKKKNEGEKRLLANSSKMSYRMEKKLQAMWDNIFGIQKQETSEIKGKTNRDEIKKEKETEKEKEKEKRKPPTTAIARIVKRRRILMNGQTVEIKKQISSAETKPKTETTNKAAEKENPPDEVECTEQKDGVMKNQSHSFSGRSSSMVVSNDRKLEKKQQCPPSSSSSVSHEKPNKIIKSRTTVEDIGYRKAMTQFSYLWSQRKKEQEKEKEKATTSSLRSSSTTTSIRPSVMKKQHHISSTTNFHNTPSAYHSKPPPPSSSSSSSDFRSDRMKKALGVKVGIQPYKKTSNVEGPRSLVGSKVGIQRPPTRFLNTEKQAKLISSSSTATSSSSMETTTNPNLSNKITRNLMPLSKTPFVNNSQKILTKINRFQM